MVEHRRGGRRHRGAVDRRAGHAAHDADVPLRRHGPRRRAVHAHGEEPGHRPVPERSRPSSARTATRRRQPQRQDRDRRRQGAREGALLASSTARRSRSRRRTRSKPGQRAGRVGSVHLADPHGGRRATSTSGTSSRARTSARRSTRSRASRRTVIVETPATRSAAAGRSSRGKTDESARVPACRSGRT